ncbi:MAG: bifunctional homocysteine S-methyltransferase/methylenetetrahydrofolate reductase [Acidobacteria bacterium]|nr:MAG: bifunctional homocysteine S-methyltransferase/methylenetetrahydrofolate reductase [Acidobacteriota bacterium]
MREPFSERLEKRVVVCDGAMGTLLYAKGISLSRCFDELNLSAPPWVKDIHVGYVKAGAEVLETNTFGATRVRLAKFDLADKVREINLAGARLAREVAGSELWVAGAVGPLGVRMEPLGPTSREEARAAFREQMEALVEGGVDLIIIETMVDLEEARQALLAAREASKLPVVVQMTIQEDGTTPTGTPPEEFAPSLDEWGADVIGINCSVGPRAVLEDMAGYAARFIEAGARLVGGCCGTTPEHIRAIKAAVKSASLSRTRLVAEPVARRVRALEPAPVERRSPLAQKLSSGAFPVIVEILPPKGSDPAREVEGARYLATHGVDAVNIPDGAGATARMSALSLAALLKQQVGVDVLLHYSTRDRNVLTIQSDLLGAHALGLTNILALTRDAAQYSTAEESAVFEVDAIGLVNILNNLNRGLDVGANPLGTQTCFLVGASLNPQAVNLDEELRRFEYKVKAGANFAMTQPVFDVWGLREFLKRVRSIAGREVSIVASLWPLTSFRKAEFLNNEVPGVSIPPAVMERMRKADTGDRARAEGVRIAQETLVEIRDLVEAVQIASPFGRYAMAVEVAEVLKKEEVRSQKSGGSRQ